MTEKKIAAASKSENAAAKAVKPAKTPKEFNPATPSAVKEYVANMGKRNPYVPLEIKDPEASIRVDADAVENAEAIATAKKEMAAKIAGLEETFAKFDLKLSDWCRKQANAAYAYRAPSIVTEAVSLVKRMGSVQDKVVRFFKAYGFEFGAGPDKKKCVAIIDHRAQNERTNAMRYVNVMLMKAPAAAQEDKDTENKDWHDRAIDALTRAKKLSAGRFDAYKNKKGEAAQKNMQFYANERDFCDELAQLALMLKSSGITAKEAITAVKSMKKSMKENGEGKII